MHEVYGLRFREVCIRVLYKSLIWGLMRGVYEARYRIRCTSFSRSSLEVGSIRLPLEIPKKLGILHAQSSGSGLGV